MKSKNAKLKIILISITIVVIVIILAILFFFTDVFRTKKGAFFRYFKTTTAGLEVLNDNDFDEFEKIKSSTPYIRSGEMIVQSSSNIADSSIMDKLKLTLNSKVNNPKEKINCNIKINSSNTELFDLTLAKEKNAYAFYSPEISNAYIGIKNADLQQISEAIVGDIYVPNEIMEIKMDKLLDVTKVEKNHIDDYMKLFKNSCPDTAFSKSSNKITVDGEFYNVTSYTLKLSPKESANIQDALYSKITQDSIMMDFITSRCKLLNLNDELTDINSLNLKMREKIESFKTNPELAENIEITVSEYKQKNIQTIIKINDLTLTISHISEGNKEIVDLGINDKFITYGKNEEYHVLKYSFVKDEIKKSIGIKYKLEGTIQENNIRTIAEITTNNGIKVANYSYKDKIEFTNDIGAIKTFDDSSSAILNDYSQEEIKPFIKNLKTKINNVYVSKGASIGINLDPIFEEN